MDKYNKIERFKDCQKKLNNWIKNINTDENKDDIEFVVEEFEYVNEDKGVDLLINLPMGVGPISVYHEALPDKPEKKGPEILNHVKEKLSNHAELLLQVSESIKV